MVVGMASGEPKAKTLKALSYFQKGDALSERVRRTLVRTLYTQPSSLAAGAASGIASSLVVAYLADSTTIYALSIALSLVAIVRVMLAYSIKLDHHTSTTKLEIIYEVGAFTYAFLMGTVAAASSGSTRSFSWRSRRLSVACSSRPSSLQRSISD